MITSEELKRKALNFYKEVLQAAILEQNYFPKLVPANKILSKDFSEMDRELAPLISNSKEVKGYGYTIDYRQIKTRLHGIQDMPESITFATVEDYLLFTQKKQEYLAFKKNIEIVSQRFPLLESWALNNTSSIITFNNQWPDLLNICDWFVANYEENRYYIRELPISVHTKFIENHTGILCSLLDVLIPAKINLNEDTFEKRFKLKYAEPCIRLRFLDDQLFVEGKFKDLSIPLHEFLSADFDCATVIITENKMNYLTLPDIKNAIAVWGGGFAVKNMKDINWLKNKFILYWGDIDVQGFEILSQLRGYYNHTQSVMMDNSTFKNFEIYQSKGTPSRVSSLNYLLNDEQALYEIIKNGNHRLEQEKIPQAYVNVALYQKLEITNVL